MYWIIPALLAPILWAASNLLDEHLVRRSQRLAMPLVLVTGVFASLPALVAAATGQLVWPGMGTAVLAFVGGALGLLVYYPYLRALQSATPSAVVAMWNLAPVLIALLARWTIQESLTPAESVAVALLVASSVIAAGVLHPGRREGDAVFWMLLASILLAVASVIEKAVLARLNFLAGFGWLSIGSFGATASLAFLFPRARRELAEAFRGGLGGLLVFNEGLDLGAASAIALATSLGPVSLVHAVGGLQPVLVLVLDCWVRHRMRQQSRVSGREWMCTATAAGLAIVGLRLLYSTP